MINLSKKQKIAVDMIKIMEERFGVRWFVQSELPGITLHTMKALVEKKIVETQVYADIAYYRYKGDACVVE